MIIRNKKIILTFDDGPHPIWTNQLLNLLNIYQIKVLFFLVGKKVKQYPKIVENIISQGHLIGNHTWSHRLLVAVNEKILKQEIYDYDQYFKKNFNYSMKYFRPPWGIITKNLVI